ncbi:hypothetical protein SPRG_04259 [Saprolegnia parasitica CBS 223.65]|uniref:Uncharacterized protein n=1 Tax=Saprolegnia parasitica (strain CBS 223.65) TaxID=695850 RepID=A0A067CPF4_SAPPC|nr:hypothetical protein SPRG_04259 [Saprolegnia parasitica CBS 223.65]KDO31120.1 hypothetical protein SPRG_04259 [Saprolegnia parasitica CBS 223.65]|eukprot:XP_012198249.1 hypothetical protein SPRG_04259 [Saprolegnia parasitica CBS 223.65]
MRLAVLALCCSLVAGARQRILQEELNATDWAHEAPPETTIEVRDNLPDALDAITDSLDLTQTNWSTDQYFTGSVLVLPAGVDSIGVDGVARTQISYNYSMSPRAWSLDADPNALSMDGCAYVDGGKAMDLHVANTSDASPYAIGQVLIASAAWRCKDENDTLMHIAHLLVAEMIVNARANIIHLWAARAGMNETFATTSIRFKSNDVGDKMGQPTLASNGRRLDAYRLYDYIPLSYCTTSCGAYTLEDSQCYAHASNSSVSVNCPSTQYTMFTYSGGKTKACGYVYNCLRGRSSANLTFNIASSGNGFANPDIELYRSSGCGSGNYLTALPGSGCVRVGCANCGFWFAVNEMEFTYTSDWYLFVIPWVTASTGVYAASFASLGISLYAPDGVSKTWSNQTVEIAWPYPLQFVGVPLTVALTFSVVEDFTAAMRTSANPFVISKSVSMSSLTATTTFDSGPALTWPTTTTDITKEMTTQVQQPKAGEYVMFDFLYEMTFTLDLTVSFSRAVSFGAAVDLTLFLELNVKGGVLPALATPYLDMSTPSWLIFGNCMAPHLLEIGVYAGLHKVDLVLHYQLIWDFPRFVKPFPSVYLNQSLLNYFYNPPYLMTIGIAIDVSNAQTLAVSSTSKAALLRSLGPALGLLDLSAFVLAVQSVNATTGTPALVFELRIGLLGHYVPDAVRSTNRVHGGHLQLEWCSDDLHGLQRWLLGCHVPEYVLSAGHVLGGHVRLQWDFDGLCRLQRWLLGHVLPKHLHAGFILYQRHSAYVQCQQWQPSLV